MKWQSICIDLRRGAILQKLFSSYSSLQEKKTLLTKDQVKLESHSIFQFLHLVIRQKIFKNCNVMNFHFFSPYSRYKKRILAIYKQNSYCISTCNTGLTSVRLNRLFTHNTYISLSVFTCIGPSLGIQGHM